jgi:hypothetical protein
MRITWYVPILLLSFLSIPIAQAEESPRGLALQQRATEVIKKKNDFIARVLTTYAIPYERNAEGAVVRLFREGRLVKVMKIEIVPLFKEGADKKQQLTAHELLFYTPEGVLSLVSESVIR